mgnify:CR=1 FL=1
MLSLQEGLLGPCPRGRRSGHDRGRDEHGACAVRAAEERTTKRARRHTSVDVVLAARRVDDGVKDVVCHRENASAVADERTTAGHLVQHCVHTQAKGWRLHAKRTYHTLCLLYTSPSPRDRG